MEILRRYGGPTAREDWDRLAEQLMPLTKGVTALPSTAVRGDAGVLLTLGFHTFISFHLPFASVQEWNLFCMYASVCFFGHHTFAWPDDGVHPALAAVAQKLS